MSVEMCRCRCGGGVNLIIIHSFTSLFNRYIQSLVEVNQAARKNIINYTLDEFIVVVYYLDLDICRAPAAPGPWPPWPPCPSRSP